MFIDKAGCISSSHSMPYFETLWAHSLGCVEELYRWSATGFGTQASQTKENKHTY